ncbi:FAD-dependent oxidoreductase [Actinoallomurus purpureus]|uniref:NAD(P)/FAD-dependent oxidoreductase n=1 Tax=Actinoallomurus purpureus TaxID=478114 RepID=UPI002093E987|nr:FAD-dependent oxidoreductase [Actinoallomurus purpureus]MCO6006274.1 FAD-dependent oxidoreductase [Actinoallomurus purpureus]
MPVPETHVIVGASLAGAKAAQTLREEGFTGRVVLVGEEPLRPYERPPLTKGFLSGKDPLEKAYVHEESWYADNDVELRLGVRATGLDRAAREVRLADGERVGYTKLLLATGASVRRPDVPGADLDHVHYVRTVPDSERLRAALESGDRRVAVVGAGWIGLEAAAAARGYGNEVRVIARGTPLRRSLGTELGEVFAALHRRHGVAFVPGGVAKITDPSVFTTEGAEVPADVVIVGIGAAPNTVLAEEAGLEVDDGIVVDASLRTSDPDVYAAGDVARADNPLLGRRIRVEHWANALNGGPAAARSMLGQPVVYDRVPYFYTDQYELGMEASGAWAGGYDQIVYRGSDPAAYVSGDTDDLEFIAFWLSGGRVVGGMNVNIWDVAGDVQALIRSGEPVDTARLADPGVPLADLL